MDQQSLLSAAKALLHRVSRETANANDYSSSRFEGLKAEVAEFLRQYAGEKSAFYKQAQTDSTYEKSIATRLISVMDSFVEYVEADLLADVSPERRAQLDVVSDFLEQAQRLVSDKSAHPAIAIFLIGATLEEFLRTWIEDANVPMGNRKPGLANYATSLNAAGLITKQDVKDITSWSGLRNSAAHGEWDEVDDRRRANIMLESVNLFMRKYSS